MAVRAKYQKVLDLGEKLNIQNGDVSEENGVLKIKGTAATPYEKNLLWDQIKAAGGENPTDVQADIKVADESIYARHKVAKGESLSLISKHYYGDPMKYKAIFEANTNILKDPNVIHPDQDLVIPNM